MKKIILLITVSGTFIACKKGEATPSHMEKAIHSADSTATVVSETINSVNNSANAIFDSASIKIKKLEETGNEVKNKIEATSKIIDSLSEKISSAKLETKENKKDSTESIPEKVVVNVPVPKVIKETKVVYRDQPKKENYELNVPKNKMVKTGYLSISVDDAEAIKEMVKKEVRKNNGYIKSEELSYVVKEPVKNESLSHSETDQKVYYLQIKVPIQSFDTLINELSYNIGDIENKNIEVTGHHYEDNTICNLTVTLTDKTGSAKEPETFGEKSFAAISSGWNVITSIFLFILPLWPLFLIAGIGYYFYKKRNITNKNTH
ncbi:DUF4349 domain-containing protein [Chryseobacterium populi]|uniref:DUF4349 domain-containing protein n=1 Tax=Chryseobacterium populi TaxID=1144316 RepID=J2K9I3_9FLAO|nr:DUF4349 domain-containing protein [Chryseobacterium populi]EJL69883.1 hypothetical protein PMI13_03074 [Chryseobacterium populi]